MGDCITVGLTHFCWHPVGLIRPQSDKSRKSADAGQIHNRQKAFTLGMSLFWNLSSICGLLFLWISPWTKWNQESPDTSEGLQWLVRGVSAPPFSLIQYRTDDFSASFALLRRKALQPFPQTFATFASNVCILCLKRLHPLPQTFASTCKRPRKALPLSPQAFVSSGTRDTPHLISFIPYPRADMPSSLFVWQQNLSLMYQNLPLAMVFSAGCSFFTYHI